jgi:hypothetical protein
MNNNYIFIFLTSIYKVIVFESLVSFDWLRKKFQFKQRKNKGQ